MRGVSLAVRTNPASLRRHHPRWAHVPRGSCSQP